MSDFWDHLFNAAGHLLDANALRERERERAKPAPARKVKMKNANPAPAPAQFSEPNSSSSDPSCCIAKRPGVKLKVR